MKEKEIDKIIIKEYYDNIIPLCRLLKNHATNILLLPDNKILMQPILKGIKNYMILNKDMNISKFIYSYLSILDISKVNTKFKKTKSSIDWTVIDGVNYINIINSDSEPYNIPIINNPETVSDIIKKTYNGLSTNFNIDNIVDEDDELYIKISDDIITAMNDKKLCDLNINDNPILISRPFLGSLKKTVFLGYRVLDETKDKITVKFKQREDLGNIYTYSAFLKF